MKKYNALKIEQKWQEIWQDNHTFKAQTNSPKPKKFVLVEFPFPSGEGLHMGHLRSYTAADVISRYYRMNNFEVLYPLGWDSFGLPAENFAIKHGVQPEVSTAKNIANIKKQCQKIGYSFDWSREINTTDPNYYKWTQWLFLQFFKAGLAYEKSGVINWCPKDKTGLANEEVIAGECERCGEKVEKKYLRQWYLKITDYAEKLLAGLNDLPEWPEAVKLQQKNWIGKSLGTEIDFKLAAGEVEDSVTVFTTRPDTIFGATYLVVAPEHQLVQTLRQQISNLPQVEEYILQASQKQEIERTSDTKEKSGVKLEGVEAVNPASGEKISVWIADYVLANYGTGAIMAVPAHDERDFAFAKKFDLPIQQVINIKSDVEEEIYSGDGALINSGEFDGMESQEARQKITQKFGKEKIQYKLRDWVFSRQRYWGEPIPIIHCQNCAVQNFADQNLTEIVFMHKPIWDLILSGQKPIETRALNPGEPRKFYGDIKEGDLLRAVSVATDEQLILKVVKKYLWQNFEDLAKQKDVLKKIEPQYINASAQQLYDFYQTIAPNYGDKVLKNGLVGWEFEIVNQAVAVPENQLPLTLPKVGAYEPTGTGESPLALIDDWVNTTCPNCGAKAKRETNTMPQWAGSSWYYLRYTDSQNQNEFAGLEAQKYWLPVDIYFGGMEHTTLHLLYSRFWNIFLHDQGLVSVSEPYKKRVPHGMVLAADGSKMSKSKGNVINPDDLVNKYGADTVRMYELFLGPHGSQVSWSDEGIVGVARFLDRVWKWAQQIKFSDSTNAKADKIINKAAESISRDIENFSFNTVVSTLMQTHNEIKDEEITKQNFEYFIKLMYPAAPHICEEIFADLNLLQINQSNMQFESWPKINPNWLQEDTVNLTVQVNGKLKAVLEVSSNITQQHEIEALAKQNEKVAAALEGKEIKKVIAKPPRLINFVVQ